MALFDFNTNHKALVWTMFLVFIGLTTIVAYYPAYEMSHYEPLPDQQPLTPEQRRGLEVYVSENCMACHTQQVRNIEMDAAWGQRPAIPQDYVFSKDRINFWIQSPSLLGSERTGPDLTDVGNRKGSLDWQLLHLYEPRAVEKHSIMPSFRWLFYEVDSTMVSDDDVVVKGLPDKYIKDKSKKVIATSDALALAEYLLSLKQPKLPEGMEAPEFIPLKPKKDNSGVGAAADAGPDGKNLYEATCAACHQSSGEGIPGAFPSLKGSGIVTNPAAETHIHVVLFGKDDNPQYGPMQPFGDQFTDEEIAAIINYERTSWDNDGTTVTADDVKAVRESGE